MSAETPGTNPRESEEDVSTETKIKTIAENLAVAMQWINDHGEASVSSIHASRYSPTIFLKSFSDMARYFPGATAKVNHEYGCQEYTLDADGICFRATVYGDARLEQEEVTL